MGKFLRDVMKLNLDSKNFRLFSPDENNSNRWQDVLEVTNRCYMAEIYPEDDHLSPDGRLATYISFPAGTLGHPADLDVEVRLVDTRDWSAPLRSYQLFGGQGTLNVNSWSPDGRRFAYVAYPVNDRD